MSTPVINPTRGWDRVGVWGSWTNPITNAPIEGIIKIALNGRIQRLDGTTIHPDGATITVTIGDLAQQDGEVREVIRGVMLEEARDLAIADGEVLDEVAWNMHWSNVIVPAAVFLRFPAMDDPDIVQGWSVTASESLKGGQGKTYAIHPLLTQPAGVNLNRVEVPPGSPSNPAPFYGKGIPGGVAPLDANGLVPLVNLPSGIEGLPDAEDGQFLARVAGEWTGVEPPAPGVTSWDDLADKPLVIAAGANAAGARAAIEAVGSDDSRLSDARTPTAHEHPAVDLSDSTTVGRSVLTATSAASARSAIGVVDATVSAKGLVELATNAETQTGTDTSRAVTPAGLSSCMGIAGGVAPLDAQAHVPTAHLSAGSTVAIHYDGGWAARPDRTDITIMWIGGPSTRPAGAVTGDIHWPDA